MYVQRYEVTIKQREEKKHGDSFKICSSETVTIPFYFEPQWITTHRITV